MAVYLAYNPLYARETFKKQGMRLGLSRQSLDPRRPGPLARTDAALAGGEPPAGQP